MDLQTLLIDANKQLGQNFEGQNITTVNMVIAIAQLEATLLLVAQYEKLNKLLSDNSGRVDSMGYFRTGRPGL